MGLELGVEQFIPILNEVPVDDEQDDRVVDDPVGLEEL